MSRKSFLSNIPIIFNQLFNSLPAYSDRYESYTSNWKWIEVWRNSCLKAIDVSMETINRKIANWRNINLREPDLI